MLLTAYSFNAMLCLRIRHFEPLYRLGLLVKASFLKCPRIAPQKATAVFYDIASIQELSEKGRLNDILSRRPDFCPQEKGAEKFFGDFFSGTENFALKRRDFPGSEIFLFIFLFNLLSLHTDKFRCFVCRIPEFSYCFNVRFMFRHILSFRSSAHLLCFSSYSFRYSI